MNMRKALLFGATLLLGTALAVAQEPSSTTSPSQSGATATSQSGTSGASAQTGTAADQSNMGSGNSIQGCLNGSDGNWTLTDASGVTYKLQGDDSQFSTNSNKEVEVMGTMGTTASASASAPSGTTAGSSASGSSSATPDTATSDNSTGASSTAQANANAAKTLNVTSIHKVADSCPASQTPQQ
jgi:hypothetical protein